MKESFVFYRSFYNAISKIKNKELKADIYDAICELGLNESVQELEDSVGQIIMDLITPQILANNERYANGKKGGRPKNEETKNHRLSDKKTIGFKKEKPNENENVNVNANANENVNDNDNVNEKSADLFVDDEVETNANLFDFEEGINLFSYIQQAFGRTFNSVEYEFIATWEDNELTRYAVREGVLNNARSLKYVDTIIQAWKAKGFQTVAEVQAYEDSRKRQKSNAVSTGEEILQKFDEAERKPIVQASKDEQQEMEDILNALTK